MNMNRLLETLDKGGVLVHHEVDELRQEIQALQRDAERYRWLNKYTAHLFMCTEKGLDEQMNRAMGKGEKG
jgi:hypothetical protein